MYWTEEVGNEVINSNGNIVAIFGLQGLFTVVVAGGPRLGDFESGTVAAIGGEQLSVVSGGVACIACTYALVKWHKPFMKYDSREPVA